MTEPGNASHGSGIVRRRGAAIVGLTAEQREANALRTGNCQATALPLPAIVVLETRVRGDAMLTRFDVRGDFCGNTWHASEDDAEREAALEFGSALGAWTDIPAGSDACDFMLRVTHATDEERDAR